MDVYMELDKEGKARISWLLRVAKKSRYPHVRAESGRLITVDGTVLHMTNDFLELSEGTYAMTLSGNVLKYRADAIAPFPQWRSALNNVLDAIALCDSKWTAVSTKLLHMAATMPSPIVKIEARAPNTAIIMTGYTETSNPTGDVAVIMARVL